MTGRALKDEQNLRRVGETDFARFTRVPEEHDLHLEIFVDAEANM